MKLAIKTKTQEEYWKVMQYFEKKGYTWFWGSKPTEGNEWPYHKSKTCIFPDNIEQGTIQYGPQALYYIGRPKFVSFKEYLKLLEPPTTGGFPTFHYGIFL